MYFPLKGDSSFQIDAAIASPLLDSVTLHPARRNSVAIENSKFAARTNP